MEHDGMEKAARDAELENAFLSVWRQALVEGKRQVVVSGKSFSVRRTAKRRLLLVDFEVNGHLLRGLEQNPETSSRWAELARNGAKVMQFLANGRYLAVVADGKLKSYSRSEE